MSFSRAGTDAAWDDGGCHRGDRQGCRLQSRDSADAVLDADRLPDSGKIDIISAAMYGSPERAKVVDFSQDAYACGEGLVLP
ncbi:MAG: transporter substrate-binding domain-containing protein, partial [Proteobacteria bacterium]|nr:transporter substrate-binding domain-containing protein [Pseudomonadota bacterium]